MTEVTLEQIAGYCTELGLMNKINAERRLVETIIPTNHRTYHAYLKVDAPRDVMQVRIWGVVIAPPERRAVMARVVAHVNYNLLLKGFVFDWADGEVAYDLPVPFRGTGISAVQLDQCLQAAVWTLNTHTPTLFRAAWGSASAEELLGLPMPDPADALTRALTDAAGQVPPVAEGGSAGTGHP